MVDKYLVESIKSIRNLSEIFLIIYWLGREDLLYTLAEDIGHTAQVMLEEYCVEKEAPNVSP